MSRHAADALLPALQPAARLLFLEEADPDGEARGALFGALGRASPPLREVAEVAQTLGHGVTFASSYQLIGGAAPEVLLLDGAARGVLEMLATLQELRATHQLEGDPPILVVVSPRVREEFAETLCLNGVRDLLSTDASRFEIRCRIESAVALFRALAEVRHGREQLARQIRVDDVTGVMSRRFFFQQAHRECSRSRRYRHPLSCLMIEVDHFKMLSSTYGEAAADHVLRGAATIIGQWTRDSDIVARFAPSKFVVLLPETAIDGATSAREKLALALAQHRWRYGDEELPITVSVGEAQLESELMVGASRNEDYISEGDEGGEGALSAREALAGLLEDADAALYIARKAARTPDVFVPYTPAPDQAAHVVTAYVPPNSDHPA